VLAPLPNRFAGELQSDSISGPEGCGVIALAAVFQYLDISMVRDPPDLVSE
jgi:hypothetical protein